jgi:hypothetical protein
MTIYDGYRTLGPYKDGTGRDNIHIYFPDGHRKVTSLARYIMERYLDRELLESETIDHIDRDFNNNDIGNLQILNRLEHISLDHKRVRSVVVVCVWCVKEFSIDGNKIKQRNRR